MIDKEKIMEELINFMNGNITFEELDNRLDKLFTETYKDINLIDFLEMLAK